MVFFQELCSRSGAIEAFTIEGLHRAVEEYLAIKMKEASEVKAKRRPEKPTSTTEDMIMHALSAGIKEFESGFWIPDLFSTKNIELLLSWDGQWAGLNSIAFCRLSKDNTVRASKFPPTGKS